LPCHLRNVRRPRYEGRPASEVAIGRREA